MSSLRGKKAKAWVKYLKKNKGRLTKAKDKDSDLDLNPQDLGSKSPAFAKRKRGAMEDSPW